MNTENNKELMTSSRMTKLLVCPRAHYWRYEFGLKKDDVSTALMFGSSWHVAMEARASGAGLVDAFESATAQKESLDGYDLAMLGAMLAAYYAIYQDDELLKAAYEPEKEFRHDIKRSRTFVAAGKIDGLATLANGKTALIEHKTTSDSIDAGSDYWTRLRWNQQLCGYVLAAREMGYDISTVIYDVVRKPAIRPSKIQVLDEDGLKVVINLATGDRVLKKDGTPKQSKSEGEELQTRQEEPAEYQDRLCDDIMSRPEFYFARREVPVLDDDISAFEEHRLVCGTQILAYRVAEKRFANSSTAWPRNVSWGCKSCEYESFCLQNIVPIENDIPVGFSMRSPFEELNKNNA